MPPPPPVPPLADFILGDWIVQPGLNRLTRNGEVQHVRPQLMDVLVCLADAGGRTVHRNELLRTVWPGQSTVAETAIARCIAELRHALGDRANAPRHIETVHKRGYRVIAPVAAATPEVGVRPAAPRPEATRAESTSGVRPSWAVRARLVMEQVAGVFLIR